ncbi:MAG: class I SAM-dependent methyltransferase, partial [Thermoleophilaceae bacterium]|nr:class I SAM-dependent methyltransferase [Thermoleophilaceae bacterium]
LAATGGCELIGADRSAVALEWARQRVPQARTVLIGHDERLPLDDNSVDLAWCAGTLEHVVDTQTVLSELRRVLRVGARLAVITPNHSRPQRLALALFGWDRHFDPFSPHLRFYTKSSLRDALAGCGLEVESLTTRRGQLVCVARRA